MADIQGYVFYPNINQINSATYTAALGIAPGIVHIEMVPQEDIPLDSGDVVFSYGDQILTISECKLDAASFRYDESGLYWGVSLWDRRWKWKFALRGLSGRYNIRNEAGDILEDSQKAPFELALLCLSAMGETLPPRVVNLGIQLAALLPFSDSNPFVEWNYTNPAEALESLAEYYGCKVSLDSSGMLVIVQAGVGEDLPDTLDITQVSATPDPLEAPNQLVAVVPQVRQYDFTLTPVGRELTGKIVRIKDLSYRPDKNDVVNGGWNVDDFPYYHNVDDPNAGNTVEDKLANEWIFRAYQIELFQRDKAPPLDAVRIDNTVADLQNAAGIDPTLFPPGQFVFNRFNFLNRRVDKVEQDNLLPDGSTVTDIKELPPLVYGIYYNDGRLDNTLDGNSVNDNQFVPLTNIQDNEFPLNPAEALMVYRGGYFIDLERGIVFFDEPVYKSATMAAEVSGEGFQDFTDIGAVLVPARLVLRIAYQLKNETHQFISTEIEQDITPPPEKPNSGQLATALVREFIVYDDLTHETRDFPTDTFVNLDGQKSVTNFDDISDEAKRRLTALQDKYETFLNPQVAFYVGLKLIALDGAIVQVTWNIDKDGTKTTAYRNNDIHPYLMSYQERRYIQKTKGIIGLFPDLRNVFSFASDKAPTGKTRPSS